MKYKPKSTTCSRCSRPRRDGGRLCKACHAAAMKESRKGKVLVDKRKLVGVRFAL